MTQQYSVNCDCRETKVSITGSPKVHAYCHCGDCRELLQVPYHSVLAFAPEYVSIDKGQSSIKEFKRPNKNMTRVFCMECGDILYNTNAMGWKLVSQLLFRKCNEDMLPDDFRSSKHIYYEQRVIDIDDNLPK